MAFLHLVLLALVVSLGQSLPADTDSARQAANVQNVPTPTPAPLDCTVFVGTKERKLKPGCQICWSPPEYITCKNGDWDFGTCGDDNMKCVHTSECSTTCVPRPPTEKPATFPPTQPPQAGNSTLA